MDSLTEGLSSLTPTSPTTVCPPPIFPSLLPDVPHSEYINVNGSQSHAPTLLSQSAPSTLCHIRTDHAYQVTHSHVITTDSHYVIHPQSLNSPYMIIYKLSFQQRAAKSSRGQPE